jgi:hypothetical protein
MANAVELVPSDVRLTTTVVVLAAGVEAAIKAINASRRYIGVRNIGADDAYLGFGATAVQDAGWPVYSGGDGLVFEGSSLTRQEIRGISAAGTTIIVLEG